MIKLASIRDLYECVNEAAENEWVYVNRASWSENPAGCEFFIISESEVDDLPDDKVYESEAGPFLPVALKPLNLYPWMEIDTLQGVIENLKLASKGFDDQVFIMGINHYREYDTFLDV